METLQQLFQSRSFNFLYTKIHIISLVWPHIYYSSSNRFSFSFYLIDITAWTAEFYYLLVKILSFLCFTKYKYVRRIQTIKFVYLYNNFNVFFKFLSRVLFWVIKSPFERLPVWLKPNNKHWWLVVDIVLTKDRSNMADGGNGTVYDLYVVR